MSLLNLFKKNKTDKTVRTLYAAAVTAARRPGFYTRLGLPDTAEGRLEAVMLHVYLILRRLKGESDTSQALFDVFFEDMDQSLREMGVGDLGVPHRIKAMAEAFLGRIQAYDEGLAATTDEDLIGALARNFYRTAAPEDAQIEGLGAYMRDADQMLASQPMAEILKGRVSFPAMGETASS